MLKATSAATWLILFGSCCADFKFVVFWSDRSYSVHFHFLPQCFILGGCILTHMTDAISFVRCQILTVHFQFQLRWRLKLAHLRATVVTWLSHFPVCATVKCAQQYVSVWRRLEWGYSWQKRKDKVSHSEMFWLRTFGWHANLSPL